MYPSNLWWCLILKSVRGIRNKYRLGSRTRIEVVFFAILKFYQFTSACLFHFHSTDDEFYVNYQRHSKRIISSNSDFHMAFSLNIDHSFAIVAYIAPLKSNLTTFESTGFYQQQTTLLSSILIPVQLVSVSPGNP